jgi:acyl-coenzyme A synthetase/AMP-(fatty) acid ligase
MALAACGGDDGDSADVGTTGATGGGGETIGVSLITKNSTNPFFIAMQEGAERDAEALRAFVKTELAPYKCPREIVFLDALPRTPTGKLQRFRLRALE